MKIEFMYWVGLACFIMIGYEIFVFLFSLPFLQTASFQVCQKDASLCYLKEWLPFIIVLGVLSKIILFVYIGNQAIREGLKVKT